MKKLIQLFNEIHLNQLKKHEIYTEKRKETNYKSFYKVINMTSDENKSTFSHDSGFC